LALSRKRHKSESQRERIVEAVDKVRAQNSCSKTAALKALQLSRSSYYRYLKEPVPKSRTARKRKADLSAWEKHLVCEAARTHSLMGYKRLTWHLQNEFAVGVRAHETARVLREAPEKAPAIVHDSGSQFLSKEWRRFAEHHGMPSIRTRIAHPQSNGKVERIHRTHRTEALAGCQDWPSQKAREELSKWAVFYNEKRPHHALKGLPPVVY